MLCYNHTDEIKSDRNKYVSDYYRPTT